MFPMTNDVFVHAQLHCAIHPCSLHPANPPHKPTIHKPPAPFQLSNHTIVIVHPTSPSSSSSPPQPLQLPQHHQIRVQKPINALPHTRLLVFIQRAVLDPAARDALLEAHVGERVNRWFRNASASPSQ